MVTAVDSSGNGYDGTYRPAPQFISGLIPGDRAWIGSASLFAGVDVPTSPIDWNNSFSIEFWFKGPAASDSTLRRFFHARQDPFAPSSVPGLVDDLSVDITMTTGGMNVSVHAQFGDVFGVGNYQADACVPYDGLRHHIVFTYAYIAILHAGGVPAGTGTIYVDGSSQTLSSDGSTPGANPNTMNPMVDWQIGNDFGAGNLGNDGLVVVDEYALYDHVLTGGAVAAHLAAADNFADYTAAVLADSPTNYYHLNDGTFGWHVGYVAMGS